MAWTVEQLNALEAAIAQGTTEVKYQDRSIKYRSLAEMMQLRDTIRKSLGLASGRIRLKKAEFSKGL